MTVAYVGVFTRIAIFLMVRSFLFTPRLVKYTMIAPRIFL